MCRTCRLAGGSAADRLCQADLIDGRVLRRASHTGMAAWHRADVWHTDNTKRDALLQRSQELAVKELVYKWLSDYLSRCNNQPSTP